MIDNSIIGKRISEYRQDRGLTQQQLASIVNVSHQAVSKWESGAALPDIQTLLILTRFFGITVEQLFGIEEECAESEATEAEAVSSTIEITKEEADNMTIDQLLQVAPYMTKAAVSEIAMQMETELTAQDIGKLAPYLTSECISALIEKNRPELTWETVRRIAPFMAKEAVDALARKVACGKDTVKDSVKDSTDSLNKTIDDIGRAFDDIGKGAKRAMHKAIRFGSDVINDVSSALNERTKSSEPEVVSETRVRSDRAIALRKRAFTRALTEGKWDWIAAHLDEIEDDAALKTTIAAHAKECGMFDWICENMGGYADESTIRAAAAGNNWGWLSENVWQMEKGMQQFVALAAMRAENWNWLVENSDSMDIADICPEICRTAWQAGERELAAQLAIHHLDAEQLANLARAAFGIGDYEMLDLVVECCEPDFHAELLKNLADRSEWDRVQTYARYADTEMIEELLEKAVDSGNFDAIDMLDNLL